MLEFIGTYENEAEYRADKTCYNYSLLKDFCVKTPLSWRKKHILGDSSEDDDNQGIKDGLLIDVRLLGKEDEFESKYHLSQISKLPGEKAKLFSEALMRLTVEHSENDVLLKDFYEIFKEAYLEVGGVGNSKVETYFQKFEGSDAEAYYSELRNSHGKAVVSLEDIERIDRVVNLLKVTETTSDFFLGEGINQLPVKFSFFGTRYKALLDRVRINHEAKTIKFGDLKSSWQSQDFPFEYLKLKYFLQQGIYEKAGAAFAQNNFPDYEVLPFSFYAVDASGFVKPLEWTFEFTNPGENPWMGFTNNGRRYRGIEEIVSDIEWHKAKDEWMIKKSHFELGGRIKHTF